MCYYWQIRKDFKINPALITNLQSRLEIAFQFFSTDITVTGDILQKLRTQKLT